MAAQEAMNEFTKHLNKSQLEVVTTVNGPILVIAGAGSGKTRVIEYRVLHLVQQAIPPESILLLTFTRRAAGEMLLRASRHDRRCSHVEGGTFHSFAYKQIKQYAALFGFESFTILDEPDAQEAIALCARKAGAYQTDKRFPKKDTLKDIISMALNKHKTIEEVLDASYPHFFEYASEIESIKKRYADYKVEKSYLDFDDLLTFFKDLLVKHPDVASRLHDKYRFIMVDEYQDTNMLQADITYLLAKDHKNVMVVGDDAQSIYGFRGASHANIMEFPGKFPGCKVVKLEDNYRSSQEILDVANAVLNDMRHKYAKKLVSATGKAGSVPLVLFFNDIYEEAEWVAGRAKDFYDEGVALSSQAVLFRSAYVSIPLQAELSRRNIPYQVYGGLKFYETAHVKDALSYLKVLNNYKDELAWSRILQLLEGIGTKTAQRVLEQLLNTGCVKEAREKVFYSQPKEYKYGQHLKPLGDMLLAAEETQLTVAKRFSLVLDYYYPLLKEKFDDWDVRLKDLETLQDIASRYVFISDFLADFAIEPPEKNALSKAKSMQQDGLVLSTIHSAKGLEWDCVFMIGLMEGVLPVSFSLSDENEIEEEHRLFYVGVTRARKHLFFSTYQHGSSHAIMQYDRISRFIDNAGVLAKIEKVWSVASEDEFEYETEK